MFLLPLLKLPTYKEWYEAVLHMWSALYRNSNIIIAKEIVLARTIPATVVWKK